MDNVLHTKKEQQIVFVSGLIRFQFSFTHQTLSVYSLLHYVKFKFSKGTQKILSFLFNSDSHTRGMYKFSKNLEPISKF